jgi:hypothetical protein
VSLRAEDDTVIEKPLQQIECYGEMTENGDGMPLEPRTATARQNSMLTRRTTFGALLLPLICALFLAGCAHTDSSSSPARGNADVAALDGQARAALAAWEPVLAARNGAPFLLKSDPSQVVAPSSGSAGSASDMDGRFKTDWLGGRFASDGPLSGAAPPASAIAWPGGGKATVPVLSAADALRGLQQAAKACDSCNEAPLHIASVTFGTVNAVSSRGQVQVPAWIFGFAGYQTKLAYTAVAPTASVLASDAPTAVSGELHPTQKLTLSSDQKTLTVTFDGAPDTSGPCGSDVSGHAFTSAHAVAVVIVEKMHSGAADCPTFAQRRTVTIGITAPLAGRVVLGLAGMPLPGA